MPRMPKPRTPLAVRRPKIHPDTSGRWDEVGWFRMTTIDGSVVAEWQRDTGARQVFSLDHLERHLALTEARRDLGDLVANILQLHINDMLRRIPDPKAAQDYVAPERRQLALWRKWAVFDATPADLLQKPILPEKVAAYRATHYRVLDGDASFTMMVGQRSSELQAGYSRAKVGCAVFITAFNPFGMQQSEDANQAANQHLAEYLGSLFPVVLRGEGVDPAGAWPPEPSFLALGVTQAAAESLGRRAHQDAVLWCNEEAVPDLLLLR
jgi:hypothetical protein